MSNVGSLNGTPVEQIADKGITERMREFMQMVESGHVLQSAVVAICKDGSVVTFMPSGIKPYTMLGAIHMLAHDYARKHID